MSGKKRTQKYEKFGLQLTQAEKRLILERVSSLPEEIAQVIHGTSAKQPITMTLDRWRELAGHIASEANDIHDKNRQKDLDAIVSKIQDLLASHTDEEPSASQKTKQPLAEEAVQLAEWAAKMLIGAERLGIKTKPVAQFPVPRAQRSILMRLPIISNSIQKKLSVDQPHLTVGQIGGLLIAVSEALMDAPPLQQFALILIAMSLKECLEAEVKVGLMPETNKTDEG